MTAVLAVVDRLLSLVRIYVCPWGLVCARVAGDRAKREDRVWIGRQNERWTRAYEVAQASSQDNPLLALPVSLPCSLSFLTILATIVLAASSVAFATPSFATAAAAASIASWLR